MTKELISVILPVYNVELYLKEAIESILNQSYPYFELIIVNDGATDNSLSICKSYEKTDKRIKLISQKNQGLSGARNTGIKNATGKHITFIDSDDVIHKDYLKLLYTLKKGTNSELTICSYQTFTNSIPLVETKNIKNSKYDGKTYVQHMFGPKMIGAYAWGKLFNTSAFENEEFPIGKLYEDILTTPYLIYDLSSITYIKTPLYFYRQREGSILNKYTPNRADELYAINKIVEFAKLKNNELLLWYARINEIRSWLEIKHRFKKFNFNFSEIDKTYHKQINKDLIRVFFPFIK